MLGSQFDAEGSLRNWWDNRTAEMFNEKAACIIEQYGNITVWFSMILGITFQVPGTKMKINGELTVGENIADNGGVKEAFGAYKTYLERSEQAKKIPSLEEFTEEQLFFLGYAQVLSQM